MLRIQPKRMSSKGAANTSRAHKQKRDIRSVVADDESPESPPPDPAAASSVVAEGPAVSPMAGRDLFGHHPGDEYSPPGVTELYENQGIIPLTLLRRM